VVWKLLGSIAAGATYLVGRNVYRRSQQDAAARAAGLEPAADLTHLPVSLQQTALWALAEGGFERRVVRGSFARAGGDVRLTAFDLEPLRERRGEWAWLPVDAAFRIGGLVSIVVCEVDRSFPHVLFKRAGQGDRLDDDGMLDRAINVAKLVRDRFGIKRSYESEMPASLPHDRYGAGLPEQWRAYTRAPEVVDQLIAAGFSATLAAAHRRDLVVEVLDGLVVVYPAARDVAGADGLADLTATALAVVDGLLAASPRVTPRGIDPRS
jgi:hypothetical protein